MALVEIHEVDKSFGHLHVLKQVSLQVAEGEIVAIIGRSGSGKSTLLRCINGLEPIQGGTIRVDGDLVTAPKADLRALRQKVGIVFQSYNLFPHLTVERNITLAPTVVSSSRRKASWTVLRLAPAWSASSPYEKALGTVRSM